MQFQTDGSITAPGFNATIERYSLANGCRCHPLESGGGPARLLSQSEGQAEFVLEQPTDCPFIDCMWLIPRPNSGSIHPILVFYLDSLKFIFFCYF
jgi:hypothetical protein